MVEKTGGSRAELTAFYEHFGKMVKSADVGPLSAASPVVMSSSVLQDLYAKGLLHAVSAPLRVRERRVLLAHSLPFTIDREGARIAFKKTHLDAARASFKRLETVAGKEPEKLLKLLDLARKYKPLDSAAEAVETELGQEEEGVKNEINEARDRINPRLQYHNYVKTLMAVIEEHAKRPRLLAAAKKARVALAGVSGDDLRESLEFTRPFFERYGELLRAHGGILHVRPPMPYGANARFLLAGHPSRLFDVVADDLRSEEAGLAGSAGMARMARQSSFSVFRLPLEKVRKALRALSVLGEEEAGALAKGFVDKGVLGVMITPAKPVPLARPIVSSGYYEKFLARKVGLLEGKLVLPLDKVVVEE